jgi:hypothetical protein
MKDSQDQMKSEIANQLKISNDKMESEIGALNDKLENSVAQILAKLNENSK